MGQEWNSNLYFNLELELWSQPIAELHFGHRRSLTNLYCRRVLGWGVRNEWRSNSVEVIRKVENEFIEGPRALLNTFWVNRLSWTLVVFGVRKWYMSGFGRSFMSKSRSVVSIHWRVWWNYFESWYILDYHYGRSAVLPYPGYKFKSWSIVYLLQESPNL